MSSTLGFGRVVWRWPKAERLLERRSMIRVLDTPQGEEAEELWVSGADIRASLEVRPAP